METYKVIFHIDEMNKWKMLLGNVSNLVEDLEGTHLAVEVLVNGEAVNYLDSTNNSFAEADTKQIAELNQAGVEFVACNNSLKGNGITKNALFSEVEVVPAGVSELVKKEHHGYAYIKP